MKIKIRNEGFEMNALEEQFTRSALACSALPSRTSLERLEASLRLRPGDPAQVECVLQATSREGWCIRREATGESLTSAVFEATSRLDRALAASLADPTFDREGRFAA